jgi:hypothetical protein
MKVPGDYTDDALLDDSLPEGKHRCVIENVRMWPEDSSEIDLATMQVIGQTTDDGGPKYASLVPSFEFVEHESNETADGSIAGDSFTQFFGFGTKRYSRKMMRQLLEAAAIPFDTDGFDFELMKGCVVDVMIKNNIDNQTGKLRGRITALFPVVEG